MHGLNASITNALENEIYKAILAGDLMLGRDPYGTKWMSHFRKKTRPAGGAATGPAATVPGGPAAS
jgi:hypothetical protein